MGSKMLQVLMSMEKKVWNRKPMTVVPIPSNTTSGAMSLNESTFFRSRPTRMRMSP